MIMKNHTMKKILIITLYLLSFQLSKAQVGSNEISAKIKSGTYQLYYGDLKISYVKAKTLALEVNNSEAYEFFKKAKRIRNWDLVWGSLSTAYIVNGILSRNVIQLAVGLPLSIIPYLPSRKKRFMLYTNNGIESFNSGGKNE